MKKIFVFIILALCLPPVRRALSAALDEFCVPPPGKIDAMKAPRVSMG